MRCLVTGGAGFIGSHLVELLISEGHEVIALDNLASGSKVNLSSVSNIPKFNFVNLDIRDKEMLVQAFEGVDWVFHLAGLADIVPSIESPEDYFATNVAGTLNVLELAKSVKVKRFIYAASSSCYGIPEKYPTDEESAIEPKYPYALTKFMGEELALHWESVYKLPVVSLRLFNVYGPRTRTTGAYGAVFGVFLAQKLSRHPYTVVGDGMQSRDFTYVTDVARAFLAAAKSDISGESINVGSGSHYSINKLVELLGGEVEYISKRPGEPDCTFAKIEKIKNLLGWEPKVSLEEGVRQMLLRIDDWKDAPIWNSATINKATKSWFEHLGN